MGGWAGTSRTIREMQRLVKEGRTDPTVIFAAEQLARKRDPKDYKGQVEEIFDFVKQYIHYVRDPRDVELLRSAFQTLYVRAGDCDDQAVLFSALAEAIGFKTQFKTIKADSRDPSEFSHVYSQVLVPGYGWVSADTIVKTANVGWEAPEQFGSHVWKGGIGMLGGTFWDQVVTAWDKAVVEVKNKVATNAAQQLSTALKAPAVATGTKKKPKLPAWLAPLGIVAVAGGAVIYLMRKKRRR